MIEWKPIEGYDGKYYINQYGQIISHYFKEPRMLSIKSTDNEYLRVNLTHKGKRKRRSIHRLVAETFKPNTTGENLQINHIDGDKFNNHVDNLEWCTCRDNISHAFERGLNQNNNRIILTDIETKEDIHFISQRRASEYLGRKQNYICRMFSKGINIVESKNGKIYKVKREN